MNSCITDIIRNNDERLQSIKVPFSIGTQACTMLKPLCCLHDFGTVYDVFPTPTGWFRTVKDGF